MNKLQRSKIILERLDELYPNPPIPLNHSNNFTLLVAVVLSAQSTDVKVNQLTEELFKVAKDPISMFKLGKSQIYNYIKELGLSKRKSKYIHELSKIISEKYSSKVPNNFNDLESLPGVGHKTASVVMAQAFGIPTFPVDTHIHRLAQRWGLTSGINVTNTERDLKRLFPKEKWSKLHLQIIYYGREYCTATRCNGTTCGLCRELYPNRKIPVKHKNA